MDLEFIRTLTKPAKTKIVLLVLDGLGGLPSEPNGLTELEAAKTPNLDDLAARSICGLQQPVGPGITPGSGAGHLALFGYDPIKYQIGRGVLSALGTDFDLTAQDVAARGNFCTVDDAGRITDRRAGRIGTEVNERLCERLRGIALSGVELFVQTVKEHRFLLVLRGDGLAGGVTDTDPQEVGREPLLPKARTPKAERTARLVGEFVTQARTKLAGEHPANMVLLRGFAMLPDWPTYEEAFGLRAAAIADYPMYRGVAKLLGMQALATGPAFDDKLAVLAEHWNEFDFFFIHVKPTDSAGEDGDHQRKSQVIESVDGHMPKLLKLGPDVLIVTGDHSTPAVMKSHSWHPVPVLLWSQHCRPDGVREFGERACLAGGLGPAFPAAHLLPLALANAHRLEKFGA